MCELLFNKLNRAYQIKAPTGIDLLEGSNGLGVAEDLIGKVVEGLDKHPEHSCVMVMKMVMSDGEFDDFHGWRRQIDRYRLTRTDRQRQRLVARGGGEGPIIITPMSRV